MKTIFFPFFIALLLLLNGAVQAAPGGISKQDAMNIATQSNPGRVLSVKRKANAYQVKTLSNNGTVRVIKIDANSGRVISGRNESSRSKKRPGK